ncbi:hypothetical protein N656DRAFT_778395 [Canariomyces notabilis]|uniref:Secreted protein n=1 Tax=Canariomyces notabilis TaxID=2074819 RepID=A0AAN6TG81_9PEZI|nr:hypothetical protein N656DRAFT_778395 [Canariomyces arenarius]
MTKSDMVLCCCACLLLGRLASSPGFFVHVNSQAAKLDSRSAFEVHVACASPRRLCSKPPTDLSPTRAAATHFDWIRGVYRTASASPTIGRLTDHGWPRRGKMESFARIDIQ